MGAVQGYLRYLKDDERRSAKSAADSRVRDARALEIELRIAERSRDLIPIDDALTDMAELAGLVRSELAGLPARLTRISNSQTIAGTKTFSTVPKSTQDATGSTDLVRKSQVDALLAAKAPLASPGFTGTPTAPTAAPATSTTQIATTAFVQDALSGLGTGDMAKSVYDANNNGKVDSAESADAVAWTGVTGKPSSFTPATHTHPTSEITGLDTALAAKAPLASPALTGTPTAPTATAGTSSTQLATTAFVAAAVAAVVNGSPGALDTLNELAAALGNDANFSATVTNSLAGKLAKDSNLSDLSDAAAARTNLALGTMSVQNASAVAITGGSVDGITLDGGTF